MFLSSDIWLIIKISPTVDTLMSPRFKTLILRLKSLAVISDWVSKLNILKCEFIPSPPPIPGLLLIQSHPKLTFYFLSPVNR